MHAYSPPKSRGQAERSSGTTALRDAQHAVTAPATTAQMKLHGVLNESAAARSLKQLGQAVNQRSAVVAQRKLADALSSRAAIQREEMQDDDELLQGKFEPVQRQGRDADILGDIEDEEPLQRQFAPEQREVMPDEDELLQAKCGSVQRQRLDPGTLGDAEDEEVLQGRRATAQRQVADDDKLVQTKGEPVQRQESNRAGLPDQLKAGVETLSGLSLDDVRVHYNSAAPAPLQATAYAQGTDIHLAPGQERHLPHEAWHVVQQEQGRVQPTMQAMGVAINDDVGLEREADVMGAKALQMTRAEHVPQSAPHAANTTSQRRIYQRVSAGGVLQLIYLWNRAEEDAPHWDDAEQPPEGYLASGRHDDGVHGDDNLYARLGEHDLFYGLNFDDEEHEPMMEEFLTAIQQIATENDLDVDGPGGFAAAIRLYEQGGGNPMTYVDSMKALYSGSSGWDTYQAFLPDVGEQAAIGPALVGLNPDLPWADQEADRAGFACQVAMVQAIRNNGSVRFLLDGMQDIRGIVEQTSAWSNNVTSHELRFALGLLGQQITVADNEVVTPVDGTNVFFYLNRQLVSATDIPNMD